MQKLSGKRRWSRQTKTISGSVVPFLQKRFQRDMANIGSRLGGLECARGGKIRPVDDFSQFLINALVTCHEKIDLEGIDSICATARFFLGASTLEGVWYDGGTLDGPLSKSWMNGSEKELFGRCLDLRQTYKQLAKHPDQRPGL